MRVGLVGCVKTKGPAAAPAGELYTSPLFTGRRRFVEATCERSFILSARRGLLDAAEVVDPYDESLVDVGAAQRHVWAESVLQALDATLGDVAGMVFEVHAGAAYRDFGLVDGLRRRGAAVVVPAAGMSQGEQLAFYSRTPTLRDVTAAEPVRHETGRSAYSPLGDWLGGLDVDRVTCELAELETLLGRALPPSARQHRPWWGNHDRSPQARVWLDAGWRVAVVDLRGGKVTFEKTAR